MLIALKAVIIGLHTVLPNFPPLAVRKAKFPVLLGLIDTRRKALALLLLRKLKEELDDVGRVEVKMFFQIPDRAIAFVPEHLVVTWRVREPFAAGNFAMYADDHHFFAIGSVKEPICRR